LFIYINILRGANGSNAFSACKYTKFLYTTKQNTRKLAQMLRKTTKRPGKESIFSEAFGRFMPGTCPLAEWGLPVPWQKKGTCPLAEVNKG
jgi:hypothetical protein